MVIIAMVTLVAATTQAPPETGRAPISVADLVELAEIGAPVLSPDGKRVAFRVSRPSLATNRVSLDWYVAELGRPVQTRIGSGGSAIFEGSGGLADEVPVWDGDSGGLRYRAKVEGIVAIWHWRDGEAPRREIVDDADIRDFASSTDGSTIRYTVGATRTEIEAAERKQYEDGALVDARLDIMQPVAGGAIDDGNRVMQQLPTEWFERERLLSDAPPREKLATIAPAKEGTEPVFEVAEAPQAKAVRNAKGDRAEIVVEDDWRQVRIERAHAPPLFCTAAPCKSPDLAAIAWVPGSDALLLFERVGSARETVWYWRVGAKAGRKVAVTDGAQRTGYRAPRCVAAPTSLICSESGPLSPPRLVEIDLATGIRHILADPNAAVRGRIVAEAETFEPSPDVSAVLLRPRRAAGPLPLVVQYYHCAGFLKGGVGDEIPMLPLVESEIAILCLERTHTPKGLGIDARYDLALGDIGQALDELAAKGVIDSARIGISGLSFGSEVALWSIRKSKRFATATVSSGQISSIYYWANALPGRGFAEMLKTHWGLGDPDSDADRWRTLAPEANTGAIDTPLLMQLPESEARYAIEFHARLKRAGKPAEMFVFADEPHIKNQPVHKRAVYARNLDWYRFWLLGAEDPDPAKRGQYARWRALRAGQSLPTPAR